MPTAASIHLSSALVAGMGCVLLLFVSFLITPTSLDKTTERSQSDTHTQDEQAAPTRASAVHISITGVGAALPGKTSHEDTFSRQSLRELFNGGEGANRIERIPDSVIGAMQSRNIVQLRKHQDGTQERIPLTDPSQLVKLAGRLGPCDLTKYGVSSAIAATMDPASQYAVAAGLEALREARLVSPEPLKDPSGTTLCGAWQLPEHLRAGTAVIYAASFPALEAAISETQRFATESHQAQADTLEAIRQVMRGVGGVSAEEKLKAIELAIAVGETTPSAYEFDRKFLFKVLVLANAQLAQIIKARGPNTQTNAACAGTTQAIAMAQDMIAQGRAERVVVISGDNASSDTLMPWLGSGFRALGAASVGSDPHSTAVPFDARRSGMIVGAGAVGIVLESANSSTSLPRHFAVPRGSGEMATSTKPETYRPVRLVDTLIANSAYHGAALDTKHISSSLSLFLDKVERVHGIPRGEIARQGIYLSHETMTKASAAQSCAANEVAALRSCFSEEDLTQLLILNTKGCTGHAMGVSFEDVVCVEALRTQTVPPVPNLEQPDPYLGALRYSTGGSYPCKYALRFAAGFGSQVSFALYAVDE